MARLRSPLGLALAAGTLVLAAASPAAAQSSFVNFETPHVSPLALTPDGSTLLAVNTPDARLELLDASGLSLVSLGSVPVGLDPVSVRARGDGEAWVVNHVSDSVSIVDLATQRVVATLDTDDEPADVVFAGSPERAFVSCSQANTVLVFDPADLSAAPIRIALDAEDPRALAVSPDGQTVYVAVFESGNGSTLLGSGSTMGGAFPPNVVDDGGTPHGTQNPPPNDGNAFDPPIAGGLPAPPEVGLIVKQDAAGHWMDDNGGDWTDFVSGTDAADSGRPVGWDLPDRDIAVIDAATLAVSWVPRLMNINMALAVNPADGRLAVVGTDGTNEVRFEPVLNGRFLRVQLALVDVGGATSVVDLNGGHLDYASPQVGQALRDESIGDPRGIAWLADGSKAYVTGMGSDNVVVVDGTGARAGLAPTIEVGGGPTGIVLHEAAGRLYVLDKFESAISTVSLASETEVARLPLHDASPAAIRDGRRFLYSTHLTSGLGHVACASCHVDARMDRLAWDLGDPGGAMKSLAGQNLGAGLGALAGTFEDFHPMKGPMLTQTLQDIIGKEPLHWRGDRDGLEEFNGAFLGLQGDDTDLTPTEMQQYEDFLATIHFPPNPFRNRDNSLPDDLPLPGHFTTGRFAPAGQPLPNGDAVRGLELYRPPNLLDAVACVTCHTMPTGVGADYEASSPFGSFVPFPIGPNGEHHAALVAVDGSTNVTIKVPQLRNLYERTGFNLTQTSNRAGFGFLHDGSVDSIERFLTEPVFDVASDQDVADLVAFMLAFSGSDLPAGSTSVLALEPPGQMSRDAHAAVGVQTTLVDAGTAPAGQLALIDELLAYADAGRVGVVAHGTIGGIARGYAYLGSGTWQPDRAAEATTTAALEAAAAPGAELTFTVVPFGSQERLGNDRDEDGFFDRDELDAGSDPADPTSTPGNDPWVDLGDGLAGSSGVPLLTGTGPMTGGSVITLALSNALAGSTGNLVIGLSPLGAPFKGGVLVPSPDFVVGGLPVSGSGTTVVGGALPGGLPSGFSLFFQSWISDPAGPKGLSASNGVSGTTP